MELHMLSKKLESLLNDQISTEARAANTYLAMASWTDIQGFSGIAKFLYHHSDEERVHMLKLFHFVNERGGHAIVPTLKAVPEAYKSIQDIFEHLLSHEIEVSQSINNLVDNALKGKDYPTVNFLQWYVEEQMEEERLACSVLDKLKLIGNDKGGLYLFDRDLGQIAEEGDKS